MGDFAGTFSPGLSIDDALLGQKNIPMLPSSVPVGLFFFFFSLPNLEHKHVRVCPENPESPDGKVWMCARLAPFRDDEVGGMGLTKGVCRRSLQPACTFGPR